MRYISDISVSDFGEKRNIRLGEREIELLQGCRELVLLGPWSLF